MHYLLSIYYIIYSKTDDSFTVYRNDFRRIENAPYVAFGKMNTPEKKKYVHVKLYNYNCFSHKFF